MRLKRYAKGTRQSPKSIKQIKAPNNEPNDGDICLSFFSKNNGDKKKLIYRFKIDG